MSIAYNGVVRVGVVYNEVSADNPNGVVTCYFISCRPTSMLEMVNCAGSSPCCVTDADDRAPRQADTTSDAARAHRTQL
jgi:hypothetical protein